MPLVLADRVRETTTTTGTGTISLAGPVSGFQGFSTAIGNANTTYYTIVDAATGAWEVGLGTYTSSGSTLARTTVLSSSNSDALVPFGAGTKDVFVTQPAERAVYVLGAGTGLAAGAAAFTANGVPYASATNTLTTGSALTFDGNNLTQSGANAAVQLLVNTANSGISASNYSEIALADVNQVRTFWRNLRDGSGATIFSGNDHIRYALLGSEQMRLTSTGLGIGTTSPSNKLVVSNAGANGFEFDPANSLMQTYNRSGGAYTAMNLFALSMAFKTGASPATTMLLDSSGNLGIGTISPAGKLAVSGSLGTVYVDTSGIQLAFTRPSTNYISAPNGGFQFNASAYEWTNSSQTQTYATLNSSGNLGIGTSSPSAKLDVQGGNLINGNGTIKTGFSYDTNGLMGTLSNHSLGVLVNSTVIARFDTSGNLGLGVTPSAWGFGGNLELPATNNIAFKGSYGNILSNAYYDLSQSRFEYTVNGFAAQYQIGSGGQHIWFNAPSGTAGNAITFTQALTLTANRNLLVGTTSENSGNGGLKVAGQFALTTSQAFTASGSVNDTAYYIVCYSLSGTCTLTLPTPANNTGRLLNIVVQSAQQVVSASSNVTKITDGSLTTSILPATAGKWVQLWCDGTYWNIIATNV